MFPTQVTSPLRLPQSERRDAERSSNLRIGITIIGISSIRSSNACFRGTSGWAESRKKAEFLEKGGESIEFWLQPNGLHPLHIEIYSGSRLVSGCPRIRSTSIANREGSSSCIQYPRKRCGRRS